MNEINKYLNYRLAGRLVILQFILTYSYTVFPFLGLGIEESIPLYKITFLIQTLLLGYVWLTFRKLLHEKFQFKSADLYILLILVTMVVYIASYLTDARSFLPEWLGNATSIGYSGIFILFATKLWTLPEDLFGKKKQFIYSLIAVYGFGLLFNFLISSLIGNFLGFRFFQFVGFIIALINTVYFVHIFNKAAKAPNKDTMSPIEELIGEIGEDDDD